MSFFSSLPSAGRERGGNTRRHSAKRQECLFFNFCDDGLFVTQILSFIVEKKEKATLENAQRCAFERKGFDGSRNNSIKSAEDESDLTLEKFKLRASLKYSLHDGKFAFLHRL